MTMPGRTKLQHFLYRAKNAGVEYVVLEVTSEGIEQFRLVGIDVNCAVFCNLRPEHIESHGSFEHYKRAKQKLFKKTTYIHVVNNEDPAFFDFAQFPAQRTITYGMTSGMINAKENPIHLKILGDFNVSNAMAAIAIADAYDLNRKKAIQSLEQISHIPGRMEIIHAPEGFSVVVDYAHTPDSLEAVYRNLEPLAHEKGGKLIGVLGAAGGGRDIWKREQFGSLAEQYCDQIILTNEDPYDENPAKIIDDVAKGFTSNGGTKYTIIMDRKEAIHSALAHAQTNDVIVVTGKGSEISMALAHGVKIPWSDKKIVEEWL
jgi:UDP-N-acetylmuramoyl-L-alanyl-D-glutamate--2,6-diaminopimelate ligase